jgi:gliding motility-associated-like protein
MKRLNLLILFSLIISTTIVFGQNVTIKLDASTHNTQKAACGYWFYDDGGESGNYSNNQDRWITFYSSNATYSHIKIEFASMSLAAGDTLIIYDGPNTSSPVLIKYSQANPLTPANSAVQATVNNPGGRLTVRFKTDATGNAAGWNSAIGCIKMCQRITPVLDSILTDPLPTTDYYINLCSYDTLTLAVKTDNSTFPDNHIIYNQTPANTTFAWSMGDGNTLYGPVVSHHYNIPSGYNLSLTITDTMGCTNTLSFSFRVRISDNPITGINPVPDICEGDSIILTSGINSGNIIVVNPFSNVITAQGIYDSVTFIPDGPNCPVQCYGTPVTFNQFPNGATVQQASDIESICISMEHSFAGDLSFKIICPNGQSAILDSYDNSGGNFLGQAYDYSSGCESNNPQNAPGTPWLYCWSEVSSYSYQGTLNVVDGSGPSPIPATDTITHANYLTPENPLSGLIGCPLNGTWNIEICDLWGIDNGWVFEWMLRLSSNSGVAGWQYTVNVDSLNWGGPYFYPINDTTVLFKPDSSGTYSFLVTAYDEYGCIYNSNMPINLNVIPNPVVDLGDDTILCNGTIFTLTPGPDFDEYYWSNYSTTPSITIDSAGIYSVTAINYNSSGSVSCSSSDTIEVMFVPVASVDLGPDLCVTEGPIILDASQPGSGFTYIWSTGANTPSIQVNNLGNYWVKVYYGDSNACGDADTIYVKLLPTPIINLPEEITACHNDIFELSALQPHNPNLYTYKWSIGLKEPVYYVYRPPVGIYPIEVMVIGCDTATATVNMTIEDCTIYPLVIVPTAFTPYNSDGVNDYFHIAADGIKKENFSFRILNKWGETIFYTDDPAFMWDGRFKGEICPQDVYTYKISYTTENNITKDEYGYFILLH